jgi:hypothetical protein
MSEARPAHEHHDTVRRSSNFVAIGVMAAAARAFVGQDAIMPHNIVAAQQETER